MHTPPEDLPIVSIVVPMRPDTGEPDALGYLAVLDYPRDRLEVFIARGRSPARQRNAAVAASQGEYLLFLDDDSRVTPDLLRRYIRAFRENPRLAAAGGPVLSSRGRFFEQVSELVLSEPWVTGKSACRYRAIGDERPASETELILCNLCFRRKAFEEVGGFCPSLYPNEENELLTRVRNRGWELAYLPGAVVHRPQRASLKELALSVFRYGRGRAGQAKIAFSRASLIRLSLVWGAVVLALLMLGSLLLDPQAVLLPLLLLVLYGIAVGTRLRRRASFWKAVLGTLVASTVHLAYLAGVIGGSIRPAKCLPGDVRVEEVGKRSPKSGLPEPTDVR